MGGWADGDTPLPVVGLLGTYDVANFGDLILPAVAEHELRRRLPDAVVRRYSPYGWEHPVGMDAGELAEPLGAPTPERRREVAQACDALLIGGGEILHFRDHLLAPHYDVAVADVVARAPSTWFTEGVGPADVPTAWNAIGIPFDIDDDHVRMVRAAANRHEIVVVRDQASRKRLEQVGVEREVSVVPDPGFLVTRLFDPALVARRRRLHATLGWVPPGRYLVVQGNGSMVGEAERLSMALELVLGEHPDVSVVVVQTGDGHGDAAFATELVSRHPERVWQPGAPLLPLDLVAILAGAETFIGVSLHGAITALAHGRRAVVFNAPRQSKLSGLVEHLHDRVGYAEVADDLPDAVRWALTTPGPDPALAGIQRELDEHFDRIAAMVELRGRPDETPRREARIDRLSAEHAAVRAAHAVRGRRLLAERDALAATIDDRDRQLVEAEAARAAAQAELDAVFATKTFRWLARPRAVYHRARRASRWVRRDRP